MASGSSKISKTKLLLLGFLVVTMVAIPITTYLVQQELDQRTEATPSTTIAFIPNEATVVEGEEVDFDILVAPGSNQVSSIRLVIKYDSTKLSTDEFSFTVNPESNLQIQEGPVVGTGTLSVSLNTGSDPTKVINTNTTIGNIIFYAEAPTDLPTDITIDSTTRILSTDGGDASDENVFLSAESARVTILSVDGEEPTGEPTTEPTTEPTPEGTTPTEVPVDTSGIPTCSALAVEGLTTGVAPHSVTFSASGSDVDGVIESVTFDFGDGNTETATESGGIGTDSVAISTEHTYEDVGDYTATAVLTDDEGNESDTTNCTSSITVTDFDGNTTETETETEEVVQVVSSPTPTLSPLPPTGPTETIMGIGAIGGILVIIGALLFLAL